MLGLHEALLVLSREVSPLHIRSLSRRHLCAHVLYEMSESGLLPGQRMQEAIPAMSRKLENNTMGQHLIILHVVTSLSILPTPLFFPKYNRLPLACCSSQNEWCIAFYIAWIMDIAITASWFRYKLVMKFQQRFQFQISTPGQHWLPQEKTTDVINIIMLLICKYSCSVRSTMDLHIAYQNVRESTE